MKITLGKLRKIIRESLEDDWIPEKEMFYSTLRNEAEKNGGALRVTHETPIENLPGIQERGIKKMPESHGIYFRVGWHDSPTFVKSPGAMIRAEIPTVFLTPKHVIPDDRYGSGDDGYYEFIGDNPDVVGGDIGTTFSLIPKAWIKEIVKF